MTVASVVLVVFFPVWGRITLESLLTQYQDARAQGQNTDALEKQINERLDGVLSRWLLLKYHSLPETAITNKGVGK